MFKKIDSKNKHYDWMSKKFGISGTIGINVRKTCITITDEEKKEIKKVLKIKMEPTVIRIIGIAGLDPRRYLRFIFFNSDMAVNCILALYFALEGKWMRTDLFFSFHRIFQKISIQHDKKTDEFDIECEGKKFNSKGHPYRLMREVFNDFKNKN